MKEQTKFQIWSSFIKMLMSELYWGGRSKLWVRTFGGLTKKLHWSKILRTKSIISFKLKQNPHHSLHFLFYTQGSLVEATSCFNCPSSAVLAPTGTQSWLRHMHYAPKIPSLLSFFVNDKLMKTGHTATCWIDGQYCFAQRHMKWKQTGGDLLFYLMSIFMPLYVFLHGLGVRDKGLFRVYLYIYKISVNAIWIFYEWTERRLLLWKPEVMQLLLWSFLFDNFMTGC